MTRLPMFSALIGIVVLAPSLGRAGHEDIGCGECHIVHMSPGQGSSLGSGLWNTTHTTDELPTFTLYSSPSFDALGTDISQPDGPSKLCLGCHDGSFGNEAAFTTQSAVELRQPGGAPLLALAPPQAFEQGDRSVASGGRYRIVPHTNGLTLWVQTPLAWWLASERTYPAVLDPTMQVLRAIESATIGYPYNELTTNATVAPDACVGLHDQAPIWASPNAKWSDRGYVKFKLPNLPDGAAPTNATLVGVPEPSRLSHWFSPGVNEDTLIYRVTQDWSFL